MFCHSLKATEPVDHRLRPGKHDPRDSLPLLSQFPWAFWHKGAKLPNTVWDQTIKVRSPFWILDSCFKAAWNSLTETCRAMWNTALFSLQVHTGSFGDSLKSLDLLVKPTLNSVLGSWLFGMALSYLRAEAKVAASISHSVSPNTFWWGDISHSLS